MYVYPLPSFYYNSWRIKEQEAISFFYFVPSSLHSFFHFADVSIWIFAEMVDPFYNTAGTFDYFFPGKSLNYAVGICIYVIHTADNVKTF